MFLLRDIVTRARRLLVRLNNHDGVRRQLGDIISSCAAGVAGDPSAGLGDRGPPSQVE